MGGGLTKAAIAMVDDDPALTAVIREALPQTVALVRRCVARLTEARGAGDAVSSAAIA